MVDLERCISHTDNKLAKQAADPYLLVRFFWHAEENYFLTSNTGLLTGYLEGTSRGSKIVRIVATVLLWVFRFPPLCFAFLCFRGLDLRIDEL